MTLAKIFQFDTIKEGKLKQFMTKAKIILKQNKKRVSLDKYAGKWVAFWGDLIVASNENLKDLMIKVKKMGLEKRVSVFLVPRKDEGPYVLVIL